MISTELETTATENDTAVIVSDFVKLLEVVMHEGKKIQSMNKRFVVHVCSDDDFSYISSFGGE